MKTKFRDTLNYADQLELLGIIKDAEDKNSSLSPTFQRMAYLTKRIVLHNNKLEMMIDDLEYQLEHMLEHKNKEISNLKQAYYNG